jgi:hypothetical protein
MKHAYHRYDVKREDLNLHQLNLLRKLLLIRVMQNLDVKTDSTSE